MPEHAAIRRGFGSPREGLRSLAAGRAPGDGEGMRETRDDHEEGQGTIEVLVHEGGRLPRRRDLPGVSCDVEDVSGRHDIEENLELGPAAPFEDEHSPGTAG